MIDFLIGTIVNVSEEDIVLQVGGFGIKMKCDSKTIEKIKCGDNIRIFTHVVFNQNGVAIFGFYDAITRDVFARLIGVSQVGPSKALKILSTYDVNELRKIIANNEVSRMNVIKGINSTTAYAVFNALAKFFKEKKEGILENVSQSQIEISEAISALKNLGIPSQQARDMVKSALLKQSFSTTEELIKFLLTSNDGSE